MKQIPLVFALSLFLQPAFSQHEIFSKSGVAIQGYDPVAYFKESKPVMGKEEFSYSWKGATWNFSTAQNLNDFKENPEKFAPQFGGYCAYGAGDGQGHKAPTSPDAWTIVDGKLYLNYNTEVRALWSKDKPGFIKRATENWPSVKLEKD